LATASDDGTAKVWDLRISGNKAQITLPHTINKQTNTEDTSPGIQDSCPVTSVAFHDNEDILFTGALDAQIRVFSFFFFLFLYLSLRFHSSCE
jgi:WD40 repeat protein